MKFNCNRCGAEMKSQKPQPKTKLLPVKYCPTCNQMTITTDINTCSKCDEVRK